MSSGLSQATRIPLPLDGRQATLRVPPFIQESSSDYPLPTERSVAAASCMRLDEDRRGQEGGPSSQCSWMRIKQIVSYLEGVDVRNLRQQANLKWVRIKNTPPTPL